MTTELSTHWADIIERLRAMYAQRMKPTPLADLILICQEAADEIERLLAEVANLTERLRHERTFSAALGPKWTKT